jgi:hypothetical protein
LPTNTRFVALLLPSSCHKIDFIRSNEALTMTISNSIQKTMRKAGGIVPSLRQNWQNFRAHNLPPKAKRKRAAWKKQKKERNAFQPTAVPADTKDDKDDDSVWSVITAVSNMDDGDDISLDEDEWLSNLLDGNKDKDDDDEWLLNVLADDKDGKGKDKDDDEWSVITDVGKDAAPETKTEPTVPIAYEYIAIEATKESPTVPIATSTALVPYENIMTIGSTKKDDTPMMTMPPANQQSGAIFLQPATFTYSPVPAVAPMTTTMPPVTTPTVVQ